MIPPKTLSFLYYILTNPLPISRTYLLPVTFAILSVSFKRQRTSCVFFSDNPLVKVWGTFLVSATGSFSQLALARFCKENFWHFSKKSRRESGQSSCRLDKAINKRDKRETIGKIHSLDIMLHSFYYAVSITGLKRILTALMAHDFLYIHSS